MVRILFAAFGGGIIVKKIIATVIFVFLYLTISLTNSFGCLVAINSIKKFNANEYLFIGEVVGYTKLYEKIPPKYDKEVKSKTGKIYKDWSETPTRAIGLIVKIEQNIHTPKLPNKFFEVIPYSQQADCSSQGKYTSESELSKEFPIASKVRVIGRESNTFSNFLNQDNLQIAVNDHFGLVRNDYPTDEPITTSNVKLEYKKIKYGDQQKYNLMKFELRRDLFRLEFSASFDDKKKILERLAYYPIVWEIDYEMIVKNYTGDWDKELRENLLKIRKEFLEKPKN